MIHRWQRVIKDFQGMEGGGERNLWRYITALRGPDKDDSGDIFKDVVTCLIRGECHEAMGLNTVDLTGLTHKKFSTRLDAVPYHTKQHALEGLTALQFWYQKFEPNETEIREYLRIMVLHFYNDHNQFMVARRKFQKLYDKSRSH